MDDLLLFPCNGNAPEAVDYLGVAYRAIGFIDDDPAKIGTHVLGMPVWDRAALARFPDIAFEGDRELGLHVLDMVSVMA